MSRLILASTSPWRRKLLEDAGVPVECIASHVDERAYSQTEPRALARILAAAKADAVAAAHPDAWVIGADQVVSDEGEAFGKPRDPQDHVARLMAMRGRSHQLMTGWSLRGPGEPHDAVATTTMRVRADVTRSEIEAYVASGEGTGCAGGYAIEGHGVFLFERIEGDWFNIIGLPLLDVLSALRARGFRYGGTFVATQ